VIRETRDVLKDPITSFSECFAKSIRLLKTVVVDKDFIQISVLEELLPHAKVHLCRFHVDKIFKKNTVGEENMDEIRKILRKMLYVTHESKYIECYNQLKEKASEDFLKYFVDNRENCKYVWIGYERHVDLTLGATTTNAVESHHAKLKSLLKKRRSLAECVRLMLLLHRNSNNLAEFRDFMSFAKVSYVANDNDPVVQDIVNTCSKHASKLVRMQLGRSSTLPFIHEGTHVDLDVKTCSCSFFKKYKLPCRHLFYLRRQGGESVWIVFVCLLIEVDLQEINLLVFPGHVMFHPDEVPERWHRAKDPSTEDKENLCEEIEPVIVKTRPVKVGGKAMSQTEKYTNFPKMCQRASDLAAACGGMQYEDRCRALETMISCWEKKSEVVVFPVKDIEIVEGTSAHLFTHIAKI